MKENSYDHHPVVVSLRKAADTFESRNKEYGDTYKAHGAVMLELFRGKSVTIATTEDFNRFALLDMLVGKMCRYAANFEKGGHEDSLHDLSVYAQMLKEYDNECKNI